MSTIRTRLVPQVFVATGNSPDRWKAMTRRAVVSALERTRLRPVCVFRGARTDDLAQWLEAAGVAVIYHERPVWTEWVEAALATKAGRDNVVFSPLYASADALVSTFLRLDVPLLLDPREHGEVVLYADTDALFLRDIRRADFGAAAAPAYFTMGVETPSEPGYGNAGVMLLNLVGLRRTSKSGAASLDASGCVFRRSVRTVGPPRNIHAAAGPRPATTTTQVRAIFGLDLFAVQREKRIALWRVRPRRSGRLHGLLPRRLRRRAAARV